MSEYTVQCLYFSCLVLACMFFVMLLIFNDILSITNIGDVDTIISKYSLFRDSQKV